jgi:hypothetical protein
VLVPPNRFAIAFSHQYAARPRPLNRRYGDAALGLPDERFACWQNRMQCDRMRAATDNGFREPADDSLHEFRYKTSPNQTR